MYAGAQFQNAPDPSSLPIPSFVTRASPPRNNPPVVYSSPSGYYGSPSMNPQLYPPVPFSSPLPLNLNEMGSSLKNLLNIKPADTPLKKE